ncbi:lipid II:glycine glycyltransferase FemX [Luteococcus peritonei]|uniref:Lipid II:glycine glycyltransferase FemX n=1 Tax=Luteococcus peritonei TaxID=88874 RepID=A0ABW4RVI6_9ACTN
MAAEPDHPTTVSFLQLPAWATVKPEWRAESLGWFDGTELIGAGLVLYRQMPKLKRYLAYLPEGPVLDWTRPDVDELLRPLAAHVKAQGAFGLRIGPTLVHRSWGPDTIKAAVADEQLTLLGQATADATDERATRLASTLRRLGFKAPKDGEGFAAGQPKFNFQLPLVHADGSRKSADEVLKGMNQLWRRNIKKADKAGVEVVQGSREDLAAFHEVYLVTAERDHFTPRPLAYFETMWDALNGEQPDRMRVYLARHEGEVAAATTWIRVGRHAWYSYGASSNAKREVRGSNAIQWRMIQDSLEAGATVYDLRGITEGIAADDPEIGLIQFKVGTGGQAVAYLGEWDLPINKPLYAAFDAYMNRARLKGQARPVVRNARRLATLPTGTGRPVQDTGRAATKEASA